MKVKVHKLEVYVLDFEYNASIEDIIESVSNNKHYSVVVTDAATKSIDDFTDEHPTNKKATSHLALKELFK